MEGLEPDPISKAAVLMDLPLEIWHRIFEFFNRKELCVLLYVSRAFKSNALIPLWRQNAVRDAVTFFERANATRSILPRIHRLVFLPRSLDSVWFHKALQEAEWNIRTSSDDVKAVIEGVKLLVNLKELYVDGGAIARTTASPDQIQWLVASFLKANFRLDALAIDSILSTPGRSPPPIDSNPLILQQCQHLHRLHLVGYTYENYRELGNNVAFPSLVHFEGLKTIAEALVPNCPNLTSLRLVGPKWRTPCSGILSYRQASAKSDIFAPITTLSITVGHLDFRNLRLIRAHFSTLVSLTLEGSDDFSQGSHSHSARGSVRKSPC